MWATTQAVNDRMLKGERAWVRASEIVVVEKRERRNNYGGYVWDIVAVTRSAGSVMLQEEIGDVKRAEMALELWVQRVAGEFVGIDDGKGR